MPVYFTRATSTGLIKIGHTARPEDRARELRGANGDDLETLAVIRRAGRAHEQRLHERFAHLRHHGEWFRPGQELLDFVAELTRAVTPEQRTPERGRPAAGREPYRVVLPERRNATEGENKRLYETLTAALHHAEDPAVKQWVEGMREAHPEFDAAELAAARQRAIAWLAALAAFGRTADDR
jgi:T5orf172 domain